MLLQLPNKQGTPNTTPTIELQQLVVIGANGSGKTRFGFKIEETNLGTTHRISAQKSLSFSKEIVPKSKVRAEKEFFYGNYYDNNNDDFLLAQKTNNRWGRTPNTFLLDDFDKLLTLLYTEEYEESLNFKEGRTTIRPNTKLDRVQKIWETVLPHRKLIKRAGFIETFPTGEDQNKYNASEMSDGERVIFYLSGEVICAPENSIVIIDEPEMHIHKSLIKMLFDLIEIERPDCLFIYLTHDIDFAFTRQNSTKIWAKSYVSANLWDYDILNDNSPLPEQLYLEVLGSRKPVIFLEGDSSSIDYEIYEQVYSEYLLKPLGSCEKVINSVKAFNDQNSFHHINSFGIIDRDRRKVIEIEKLNEKNIWVLDVAEAENLLLLENTIKSLANHLGKNSNDVFNNVKDNITDFFYEQLELQIILHFKEILRRELYNVSNFNSNNIVDSMVEIDNLYSAIDKQKLIDNIRVEFENAISCRDYNLILKLFNLKNALIPKSKICELLGLKNQVEYRKLVITLLKRRDSVSDIIKNEIQNQILKKANI